MNFHGGSGSHVQACASASIGGTLHPPWRQDQLSSVEAGAVLGDICDTGQSHPFSKDLPVTHSKTAGYKIKGAKAAPEMSDSIVQLTRSYRFGDDSGIACASRSINEGNADAALQILQEAGREDLSWSPLPNRGLCPRTEGPRLEEFHYLFHVSDPQEAFEHLGRFRILCALRQGPLGQCLNLLVEHLLRGQKLVREREVVRGRPVLSLE